MTAEVLTDPAELCACGCGGLPKMGVHKRNRWLPGHKDTPAAPAQPRRVLNPAIRQPCHDPACGAVEPAEKPSDGSVYVLVAGSREPGRWFCSGDCATYGIAIAELRPAVPTNPEKP